MKSKRKIIGEIIFLESKIKEINLKLEDKALTKEKEETLKLEKGLFGLSLNNFNWVLN